MNPIPPKPGPDYIWVEPHVRVLKTGEKIKVPGYWRRLPRRAIKE